VRGNRYLERKGFSLSAEFHFVDGRTGQTLHKEKFTEEVLYGEDQKVSPCPRTSSSWTGCCPTSWGDLAPEDPRAPASCSIGNAMTAAPRSLRGRAPPAAPALRPPRPRRSSSPTYGKNKVKYDNFAWRVYKSPHFEIYYYPEFEQHLARVASYAESAYQKVSST
jgi:hypothetical protein